MIGAGLEKEARWLFERNGTQFQAGKGIGYREFFLNILNISNHSLKRLLK